MKAGVQDGVAGVSPIDAAELLVAELRAGRKRLEQLIRLVNEQAGRDLRALEIPRALRPLPRYKCRRASTRAAIPARSSAGTA